MNQYYSPLQALYQWEEDSPEKIYLHQPIDGNYYTWTWKEFGKEVRIIAAYIKSLSLPKNTKIAILSKNCAHWIISDLAIMMSGNISVPLYPNLNAETLKEILNHSESKMIFAGKLDNFEDLKVGIPAELISVSFPKYNNYDNMIKWSDILKEHQPVQGNIEQDLSDTASIIYTSGTTGSPKGVMHKYFNFAFAIKHAFEKVDFHKETRFFSYLPLSHIAERLLVEMGSIYAGGVVFFAESLDLFKDNLSHSKPTVFLGVPRIWSKFQEGILSKMSQNKLNVLLSIPVINSIVKNKIKSQLGLSDAENIFCGAAAMPVILLNWFKKIGINIQEAYAMTENCCYSHVTIKDSIRIGYVGQPLPNCEVKLSDQDEILIKHKALMDGYYKNDIITSETIIDGWLHTGDQGEIDKDGFLKITGRIKDLFKTSKGKYIVPSSIEMLLSGDPNIDQLCVVGSGLSQPLLLVVLNETAKNKPATEIKELLGKSLFKLNSKLNSHERISKIIIISESWTIENKFLTPTMKLKRNLIENKYQEKYESWLDKTNQIIFE